MLTAARVAARKLSAAGHIDASTAVAELIGAYREQTALVNAMREHFNDEAWRRIQARAARATR